MPTRLLYLDRPSGGTLTESIKRVYGCHGSRGGKSNCKASMATFLREVLGGRYPSPKDRRAVEKGVPT